MIVCYHENNGGNARCEINYRRLEYMHLRSVPRANEGREDEERNRTKSKFAQDVAYGLLASKAEKEIRTYSTHLHLSRERHARGEWWARGWKRDWRMQSTTDASASVD